MPGVYNPFGSIYGQEAIDNWAAAQPNQSFAQQGFAGVSGQPPVPPATLNPNTRPSGYPGGEGPGNGPAGQKPGGVQMMYDTNTGSSPITNPNSRGGGMIGYGNSGGQPPLTGADYYIPQGGGVTGGGDPYNTGYLPNPTGSPNSRSPFTNFRTGQQLNGGPTLPEAAQGNPNGRGAGADPRLQGVLNGSYNTNTGGAKVGDGGSVANPNYRPDPGLAQIGLGGLPQEQTTSNQGFLGGPEGQYRATWQQNLPDPNASPFGTAGMGEPIMEQTDNGSRVVGYKDLDKEVNIDGQRMVRVGFVPKTADYFKNLDPSQFKYDPQYGVVTSPDNLTGGSKESWFDKYGWMAMFAIAGAGIALEAGGMLGAGASPTAAAGEVTVPGAMSPIAQGAYTPIAATPEIVAPGAAGAAAAGAGAGAGSSIMNGLGRVGSAIAGPLVRGLTGQGGGNGILPGEGGGNGAPSGSIWDLISGGAGLYQDNKSIQDIKQMMWDFYNRGDYNSQYRPGYLAQLSQLEKDPSSVIENDTGYKNMRDMEVNNEGRALNARGFAMSGNEQGEIAKLMKNMDTKYINDAKSSLRASAGLGSPEQMAAAAMRNLPMFGQMTSNRNAAAAALAQKFIGGKSAADWLKGIFNGTVKASDLPPDFEEEITNILKPGGGAASSPEDDPWGWWAGGDGWEGE